MKFTQYFLSGICTVVALTCYLLFLAERDSKLFKNYNSYDSSGTVHHSSTRHQSDVY
jgi:hypothetical protein